MRLRAAWVRPCVLRLARPLQTAGGSFATREVVLLELQDEDGHTGFGEAAPWPGFATETVAGSVAALRRIEPLLHGVALEPDEWPDALVTSLRDAPAAGAALAGALWDLAARQAGLSLAACLAARHGVGATAALAHVAVNALLTEDSPGALREQAARARAAGYRAAKLKLGAADLVTDLGRVRAAREGLGPGPALRCDANGAWDEHRTRVALAALAGFELDYLEQPLPADDIDGLARLRKGSPVRIAADESVSIGDGIARLLDAQAVDVMVLKPAMLGGPGRALEIAAQARRAGCAVVFTHAFESAVGACHALHCAAAWADDAAVHGLATTGLFEQDLAAPPACQHGALAVPPGPGLGIVAARAPA